MRHTARLALLMALVIGLAPGTWLRSPLPPVNDAHVLHVTSLAPQAWHSGPLRYAGGWQLDSPNTRFGGYSALLSLPDGRLLAGSDRGDMLTFGRPDRSPAPFAFDRFGRFDGSPWGLSDLESLTRDPQNGQIWAGYEQDNQILRLDASFARRWLVRPSAMHGWPADSGPEAMVRLRDGRFIVLAEADRNWLADTSPAVMFPDDPIAGATPIKFRFDRPSGYSPTDMAQLPDGRLLILLRSFRLGWPPRFPGKIAIADPAGIGAGETWHARVIADLDSPLPSDNFEGLAIVPEGKGAVLWVISDDNRSSLQRTLLLKFRWAPTQKAPGSSGRP